MRRGRATVAGTNVLRDRTDDRRLRTDGFVVVDLLDDATCAALRRAHGELRPVAGTGFEADLNNPDSRHRNDVGQIAAQLAGRAVSQLVVGHQPFLWNFLCKWPHDPEDLYLHRDWMFVDETAGARGFVVWMALQDVDEMNGALRILPRSHLLRGPLAGTGLSPGWIEHLDLLESHLITVPVRRGQAVVMDHALVHGSLRNLSSTPRVAVACGLRPDGTQLCHFRRTGDGSAVRYDVDESFFLTYTPAGLADAAPDVPEAAALDVPSSWQDRPSFAATLDGLRRPRRGALELLRTRRR